MTVSQMFSVLHNQSAHAPAAVPSASGALLPAWKMSQAQFESQAVCAAVDAVMVRAHLQLQPAEEADRNAVDRLRALAAGNAPASVGDAQAWAAAGVQRLLASVFHDDVLVAELPGIAHVVLVKRVQMPDGMELAEVLRRVHMRQVEEALAAGAPVPPAVREEYRDSMERLHVLQELAPREQLH